MLDVPLRRGSDVIGVLCAEHVGAPRVWTVDEQNFAISTANLIAVAIADERRREALSQVAQSDARAHLILDTAHDAFIGMDADSGIVTWNAQAEQTFGWTREEAIGRNLAETIIPPAFREAHLKGMKRFLASGEAPVVEPPARAARPASQRPRVPDRDHDHARRCGETMGISSARSCATFPIGCERDEALRRAKDVAEAATRAKSEFLANMSHELRTPLNGVIGYSQLLQRDRGLTAQQREALDAISKCGAHLLDLINDVLDLSKIEAGRIDIEQTATDLPQLITDLRHVIAETARRKGLTPHDVARSGSAAARRARRPPPAADPAEPARQRDQVHGEGRGRARHRPHDGDDLTFAVSDTGPGIDARRAERDLRGVHADQERRRGRRHGPRPDDQPPPAARSWAPICTSTARSARAAASISRCR